MIPEPVFSDDSDHEFEGPDFSMIAEPCQASRDMPPTDSSMDSEVEGKTGTTLDRLKSVQVKADTEVTGDDSNSETKSEGNNSTNTEVMDRSSLPWPYCDSRPTGRLTHPSGGPWIPRYHDYCYIDCDQ